MSAVMQKYALMPATQYQQLVKPATLPRLGGAPQDVVQGSVNGESAISPPPSPPISIPSPPPPPGQGVKYVDERQDEADLRWVDVWQSI